MEKKLNRFCVFFLFLCTPFSSFAQKLVLDTLLVKFQPDSISNFHSPIRIDTVFDLRNVENPALLEYAETTQYMFIPVDQKILADRPLAEVIQNGLLPNDQNSEIALNLGLNHLDFSKQSHYFFRHVAVLNAQLLVHAKGDTLGELIYTCKIPRWFRGLKTKQRYRFLMNELVHRIGSDLSRPEPGAVQSLPNYRNYSAKNPWMQLQTGAETALLTNGGFLIDGYMSFVFPEVKKTWLQPAGTIRYRQMDGFESIEWGMTSNWILYRYRPNWVMRFKSQLMFGLNRWKDMKTYKHELYDAFLLDFSLGQSIYYFQKNSRSVTMGIGLLENIYYIDSKGLRFEVGPVIQLGVQL